MPFNAEPSTSAGAPQKPRHRRSWIPLWQRAHSAVGLAHRFVAGGGRRLKPGGAGPETTPQVRPRLVADEPGVGSAGVVCGALATE